MTKRKRPFTDLNHFPTEVIDLYKRARELYDACESDNQTDALRACDAECTELDELLGRHNPHFVEIFTTIDCDQPPAYETRVEDWHAAKQILSALEAAAA